MIVVDKTSPRIFEPVRKRLTSEEVKKIINLRIEEQEEPVPLVGAGTELKRVLVRKYKAPACQVCAMTALKMDLKGISWCENNYEDLVDEINDNAKRSRNYLIKYLAAIGDAAGKTKPMVRESLTEAIQNAKASAFVYPFIYSENGTKELELSIKSIRKFFDGNASIFVFGDDPKIEGVTHIQIHRLPNKHDDQVYKLRAAIDFTGIPEEFVWMMDDIYFLKPLNIDDLRIQRYDNDWNIETIQNWEPKKGWNTQRRNTMLELHRRGHTFKDYGNHLPHVYTKTNLKLIDHHWDGSKQYLWDILYSNLFTRNTQPNDSFFYRWEGQDLVKDKLHEATIANSNADAFTPYAIHLLNEIIRKRPGIDPGPRL